MVFLQSWGNQLVVCLTKKQSENDVTDLQALADKEGDSIKSGTAWMCLLCGKGPHDIGQALWAVLPNALSHMPRHCLHYTPKTHVHITVCSCHLSRERHLK